MKHDSEEENKRFSWRERHAGKEQQSELAVATVLSTSRLNCMA